MYQLIPPWLQVGVEEGLAHLPIVLAATFLFRIANVPDLGFVGAFLVGAATTALLVKTDGPSLVAIVAAMLPGLLLGLITGVAFLSLRLNAMLAGILTSIAGYSLSYLIMGVGYLSVRPYVSDFEVGALALAFAIVTLVALSTHTGTMLVTAGKNPLLLRKLRQSPTRHLFVMLAFGNAMAGLAGGLTTAREGTASVNMAGSTLIDAFTWILLGDAIVIVIARCLQLLPLGALRAQVRQAPIDGSGTWIHFVAGGIGAVAYFIMYNHPFMPNDEMKKAVLASAIFVFVITCHVLGRGHGLALQWRFHGDRTW